jgi:hypothetical protein
MFRRQQLVEAVISPTQGTAAHPPCLHPQASTFSLIVRYYSKVSASLVLNLRPQYNIEIPIASSKSPAES